MTHLDTSFLIGALIPGSAEDLKLRQWLRSGASLAVSAIVWAEFLCGPVEQLAIELAETVIPDQIPFVAEDATLAARLFNVTGRRRGSMLDCMIAATAIRLNARLATVNIADFRRFAPEGLQLAA